MAENQIVVPVPIYSFEKELLPRLIIELQEEKSKNYMLSKELIIEKHKSQQLECYLLSLKSFNENLSKGEKITDERKKIPKNESLETFASVADIQDCTELIGSYSNEVRKEKIKKYKEKVKKYRQKVHVSRNFSGRSVIAKIKPRVNGKFVKSFPVEI